MNCLTSHRRFKIAKFILNEFTRGFRGLNKSSNNTAAAASAQTICFAMTCMIRLFTS